MCQAGGTARARPAQLRLCLSPRQTCPWKREVRRPPVPCTPKWRRPSGCPSTLPTPKDGSPPSSLQPLAPCSPPQLTWLLRETPGRYWHPVCSPDPTQQRQSGSCTPSSPWDTTERSWARHHWLPPGRASLTETSETNTKNIHLPPAHIPLLTTSKPPDLEMNHSSASTWCHYHCNCRCHQCARAPSTTSLPPQRGQDPPHAAPDPQEVPAIAISGPHHCLIPAPGGDRHSCSPQPWGHAPALAAWSLRDRTSLRGWSGHRDSHSVTCGRAGRRPPTHGCRSPPGRCHCRCATPGPSTASATLIPSPAVPVSPRLQQLLPLPLPQDGVLPSGNGVRPPARQG